MFEEEPLPTGSVLYEVPNLLLTPKIAGVTEDSESRVGEIVSDRILALLRSIL